jgi:hypothetical protein
MRTSVRNRMDTLAFLNDSLRRTESDSPKQATPWEKRGERTGGWARIMAHEVPCRSCLGVFRISNDANLISFVGFHVVVRAFPEGF